MEIVQHIYQIKLPFAVPQVEDKPAMPSFFKSKTQQAPSYSNSDLFSRPVPDANVYMIEGPEGNMLIDSGGNTADAYNALGTDLKNYGFIIKDIKQIVITHAHPDHTGLATRIASFSGAGININEIEANDLRFRYEKYDEFVAENLEILKASGVPPEEASQLNHMLPKEFMMPVNATALLKEGDTIIFDPFEFVVIETPGHSPGHVCLYETKKKFLFSGDTVLQEITPNIGYNPQYGKDMLGEFIKSLEKLYPLEVNLVFPGHGPAFSGMRQLIEALMRHHKERQRDIKRILEGSSKTPYQVAREVSWNVDVKDGKYEYLSILDRRLAITETVAHLEHMVADKEIGRMEENGVNIYYA
jgi:glyoxylase-like metal-dependent hydrolase (beta-lactamase superfamily II)